MHMPMMNVRVVRMPVSQHLVRMGMDMRFFAAPFSAMAMLMAVSYTHLTLPTTPYV